MLAEFPVPRSIKAEHGEIHSALVEATRVPGATGEAARSLAAILEPHFLREEQVALPPLGLLAPLSNGRFDPSMSEIVFLTDSMHGEMPRMLNEHKAIRAATLKLEEAARAENKADVVALAEKLKVHALTEEEILYPAALIAGDMVKMHDMQALELRKNPPGSKK